MIYKKEDMIEQGRYFKGGDYYRVCRDFHDSCFDYKKLSWLAGLQKITEYELLQHFLNTATEEDFRPTLLLGSILTEQEKLEAIPKLYDKKTLNEVILLYQNDGYPQLVEANEKGKVKKLEKLENYKYFCP